MLKQLLAIEGQSTTTGLDWTGLVDWTGGLDWWIDFFCIKNHFHALIKMLHNQSCTTMQGTRLKPRSSHYIILLVTCSESMQGEGCIFRLL